MNNEFINEIKEVNKNILSLNATLKNLNTMKLDGIVKYLIKPSSFIELKKTLKIIKKYNIKYHLIGNGSNVLFTNKRKECLIKLNFNKNKDNRIMYASELLPIKANEFLRLEYLGLEYLSMIPASIGGAIVMNAGAHNHCISDIIEYVYYLDEELKFKVMSKDNCNFCYRESLFKNSKKIVLGCKVKLVNKEYNELMKIMNECKEKRKRNQPIEYPNSGSIFKNNSKYKAWELIDKVGLKGKTINGAMISEKHCNFIINYDNAKYEDILYLISLIEKKVKDYLNINLEREIIIID